MQWLHIDGKYLKDELNRIITLKGVNESLYHMRSDWGGKLDLVYCPKLEELAPNVVRLCIAQGTFSTYKADVDWVIAWCKQRNIRVILDCHLLGDQPTDYPWPDIPVGWFYDAPSGEQWMSWWESVVTAYKDEPTVCGIGLLNEPHELPTINDLLAWKSRAEACVRRVKAINPNIIPFVSGSWAMPFWSPDQLNQPIPFFQQDPAFEHKAVFEIHVYPYYVFYQNYKQWHSYTFMEHYLARRYDTGWEEMQRQLEDAVASPDYAGHWGIYGLGEIPIFSGEIGYDPTFEGITNGDFPNDVQLRLTLDYIKLCNKHEIGYAYWLWMYIMAGNAVGSSALVGSPPNYYERTMYPYLKTEFERNVSPPSPLPPSIWVVPVALLGLGGLYYYLSRRGKK